MRTVLQTVRRIADEILGVKGLTYGTDPYSSPRWGGGGGVGEFWLCQDKICPMTPLVPFPSLPFPSPHWQSIFSFYAFSNDVACSVCIFENGKFNY